MSDLGMKPVIVADSGNYKRGTDIGYSGHAHDAFRSAIYKHHVLFSQGSHVLESAGIVIIHGSR